MHAQLGFGVLDQLSADVHRHAVDGAGELERAGVVIRDGGAGVGAAGERTGVEYERRGDGRLRVPGEGAVHVELEPAGRAPAAHQVGLPGRLELEPERVLARRQDDAGFHPVHGPAHVVVDVAELAVLDEQAVSAGGRALAQQHPLGAARRDLDLRGDAVRPVQDLGCGEERDRLRAGPVGVTVPGHRDERFFGDHAGQAAAVDRHHVVLARLHVPRPDHRDQPVAMIGGHVVVLGEVGRHVVKLPGRGVQLRQLLGRDRLPEAHARLGERRAGPGADGPPAVVVDRPVAQHLEVLRVAVAARGRVVQRVGEADAVQG